MTDRFDYVVIGAGLVGLATALKLLEKRPDAKVAVVDKEESVAAHQSSHNSGVIHSGIYYRPGSLKAELCVSGGRELISFCADAGIPVNICGKLIVACDDGELPKLEELYRRGIANGLSGIRRLDRSGIQDIEPDVAGIAALLVPQTAIVSFAEVAKAYAKRLGDLGAKIFLGAKVTRLRRLADGWEVVAGAHVLRCGTFVNCAGLYSDRIARLAGYTGDLPQIVPFRGEYYNLSAAWEPRIHHLIYPVPDPRFPFLGVHLTLKRDGSIEAGPNAVLAFSREGYRKSSITLRDCMQYLGYGGFWRMVGRYWRTGIGEAVRSVSCHAFCSDLQRLVPKVTTSDLKPGGSGVRAQALLADGTLCDDFLVIPDRGAVHVLNAPSPAATASLAIGRHIVQFVP